MHAPRCAPALRRAFGAARSFASCASPRPLSSFCTPLPRPCPQARIQNETNDAKNALEAYIYSLRNK